MILSGPPSTNIGNTDENADWIKTPENRASERAIHDEIVRRHRLQVAQDEEQSSDDQPE